MTIILGPSYKDYSFAAHEEVYRLLEAAFKAFGVHYYLIGANARDIALYKAGKKPIRATGDIDFAVMIPDIPTYEALKEHLAEKGFVPQQRKEGYRLFYRPGNTLIDLLPYGGIAENNVVGFMNSHVELSVIGMKEVGEEVTEFQHPEGFSIPVSPAHGIVILKLVAWSEKPERTKDLEDIKALLDASWELYEAELFQENSPYADLFGEYFTQQTAAARVMGRKMQPILDRDKNLKNLIILELEKELRNATGPKAKHLAAGNGRQSVEEIKAVFGALLQGIKDK